MLLSRQEMVDRFDRLDVQLGKLAASGAPEEELWDAIQVLAQLPSHAVAADDRHWWWQQFYNILERHGLTELSTLTRDAG